MQTEGNEQIKPMKLY